MRKISLIIVDDHVLIRQMYKGVLGVKKVESDFNFEIEVIGECGTVEEALEIFRFKKPDIVFLDVNLGKGSGLDLIPVIRKHSPQTRIIGISMNTQPVYAKKMIQMGAKGYITKSSSLEELWNSILEVMNGNVYLCAEIKQFILEKTIENESSIDASLKKITLREMEVIKLIKSGLSSKKIAELLFIDERTVEAHRFKILKKLNLNTKTSLIHIINSSEFDFI